MRNLMFVGIIFIFLGVSLFAYYDYFVKPEKEAHTLLVEGKMYHERGSETFINKAIDIFTKVIAKYPGTNSSLESYYCIAQSYEKLNLNRLAYLKYIYILKNNSNIPEDMKQEIKARIAKLKILKRYDEEGIQDLISTLDSIKNKDFRSRLYAELGHIYLKNGRIQKSKEMFDLALAENGSNEEAIIGKARSYKRLGKDAKAYDLYDYFLKYYGNFSYYTNDIEQSYMRQLYESGLNSYRKGQYNSAIAYFSRYLKRFPQSTKSENALYWSGESYFSLKDYSKSIYYFKKVGLNSLYHKDQDALLKTGYAYFFAKNYNLAVREFQSYIETYPRGKYISKAKKWKNTSTKEFLNKYQKNTQRNEPTEENTIDDEPTNEESSLKYEKNRIRTIQTSGEINSENQTVQKNEIYENVAEL